MEVVIIVIIILAVGGAIGAACFANKANKFAELGDVTGKSLEEIAAVVGQPNSVSAMAEGEILCQWLDASANGAYHFALLFKDNKCLGFTHQHIG